MVALDQIDNLLAALIHALVFLFVVLRMEPMYKDNTPKLEMLAWWCLGTGSFSEVLLYATGASTGWAGVLTGFGVLFLVLFLTQSEWRPYFLNRRVNPEQGLPPNCDRRCQTLMGSRRDKRTHTWAA